MYLYHGPGQLVAYPIVNLKQFGRGKGVRWYVKQLEQTLIKTCAAFGITASTTLDTGVWVKGDRKIAAVGE